jgi:FAD-linked oxidoreductase
MQRRQIVKALGLSALASFVSGGSPRASAPKAKSGWQNWSKSLAPSKAQVETPQTTAALSRLIQTTKGAVRPVGSGHSWTPLVPADGDGKIIRLDAFGGVRSVNKRKKTAWLGAGARLKDLSPALAEAGLAFRNLGDIDVQSLAGATSTATHGTGKNLPCLAAEIKGLKLVTGTGEEMEISAKSNAELLGAAQVALGSLGVLTEMEMQLVARHKLHRRVRFMPYTQVLEQAETLWQTHRNFEFFYIPFSATAMVITHDETDAPDTPRLLAESDDGVMQLKALRDYLSWFPFLRKRLLGAAIANAPEENIIGESWQLLASERNVPFNEMEYHLPPEGALEVLEEVRELIERERGDVFFPFECRMTAGDTAWLSPFNAGPRVSIAVHTHAPDAYDFLFTQIEPIFQRAGGRPHWGKLNSMDGQQVRAAYPKFEDFAKLQKQLDPQGRFLNPYLRSLLEPSR